MARPIQFLARMTVYDPPLPNIDMAEGKQQEVAGYVILPVVLDGHFGLVKV